MAPPRILLCGDVLGRLNQLFKRVSSVNKSAGPFDALLCVGQFFPDSSDLLEEFTDYIEGRSDIPLPTYFTGDYGAGALKVLSAATRDPVNLGFKMEGLRIRENLYWLKGGGKFTLHGLSVVYLSGRHSTSSQQFGTYSQDDVDALRALAEEPGIVDLFLTNEWPSGVTNGAVTSDLPLGVFDSYGSSSTVSELVAEIKPRYHVAATKGIFYAREPYTNVEAVHITRFLGLAPVGNKDKQKFLHAISPTPASIMAASEIGMKTTNTTLFPFSSIEKATHTTDGAPKRSSDTASDSQYWRYDTSQKRQKHGDSDGNKLCFKYLSSGSCDRGEKCHFQHNEGARDQYLSGVCFDFLIKGKCERGPDCAFKHGAEEEGNSFPSRRPRSGNANSERSRDCWFCLSSPSLESHLITSIGEHYYCALAKGPLVEDHVLVIPIEHIPTTLVSSPECETELTRFQNSLKMYFKNQGKEAVFFEWVFKRGSHANLQAIPILPSRASAIQDIFNLAAQKLGFKFMVIKRLSLSLSHTHAPCTCAHTDIRACPISRKAPPKLVNKPCGLPFICSASSLCSIVLFSCFGFSLYLSKCKQGLLAGVPNYIENTSHIDDDSSEGRKMLQMKFDRKCSLFYVELPGGTILYHLVDENEKFPTQFGREVLAGLLNKADRADWRNCKLSKEEEEKTVGNFKNRFKEYNPNP